jgi:hypothetical protein
MSEAPNARYLTAPTLDSPQREKANLTLLSARGEAAFGQIPMWIDQDARVRLARLGELGGLAIPNLFSEVAQQCLVIGPSLRIGR